MQRKLACACFALGGLMVANLVGPSYGYGPFVLKNTSPSMPLGYYVFAHKAPVKVGEIAVMRDPPNFRVPWLMKRVLATAGSRYCWNEEAATHRLDGRLMPPPSPIALKIGVPVWKGCRMLEPGEYVGYGDGPSYDSRHLGIFNEANMLGVYRPWRVTLSK